MVGFCLCFPGGTTVTTKQGVKKIEELSPLDKVLTSSRRSGQKWTTFYTWGHREVERDAEFVVLKVENGNELPISSEHLVFVSAENGKVAKKAGQVCIGDKLIHLGQTGGELELLSVVEIRLQTFTGVYAPFTMSGDFLVNGFLVGCYANVDNFDLAHAALAPLRAWYKLNKFSRENKLEGIHGYATGLMKIRGILPPALQQRVN